MAAPLALVKDLLLQWVPEPELGGGPAAPYLLTVPEDGLQGAQAYKVDFDLRLIQYDPYYISPGQSTYKPRTAAEMKGSYVAQAQPAGTLLRNAPPSCPYPPYTEAMAYAACVQISQPEGPIGSPNFPGYDVRDWRPFMGVPGSFGPNGLGTGFGASIGVSVSLLALKQDGNGYDQLDFVAGSNGGTPVPDLSPVTVTYPNPNDGQDANFPAVVGTVTVTPYCDQCDAPPEGWTGGWTPYYDFVPPTCEGSGSIIGPGSGSGGSGSIGSVAGGSAGSGSGTHPGSTSGSTIGSGTTGSTGGGSTGGGGGPGTGGSTGGTGSNGSTGSTAGSGTTGSGATGSGVTGSTGSGTTRCTTGDFNRDLNDDFLICTDDDPNPLP